MSLTDYCVYKHTNKANGKIYIGLTRQAPERRWQNGNGYKGTYFYNAIKKYGWDGFTHEVLINGLTKEEACQTEIRLINQYCSNDKEKGYNICEGGQTGDNLTPMMGADNYRAKAVIRINPATGERTEYQTINDAVKELGINHRGISKCCHGISNTYKGFVWEYAEPFNKPIKYKRGKYPHDKLKKKVLMIDPSGITHIFDSIKEAGAFIGSTGATISRYISGIRKDATGRRWSYCL